MKTSILYFVLFFSTCILFAQSPQAFKYQAVVRNNTGLAIPNQNVNLRISLLQNSTTGTQVYSEQHAVTTNTFGLVNLEIGNGTNVTGDFVTIDWNNGPYFIKIELDINGGQLFSEMGTTQLLSVPYALFAGNGKTYHAGTGIQISNDSIYNISPHQTQTLEQTLINGNNAGTNDIDMNNKSITNVNVLSLGNSNANYLNMYWGHIFDYNGSHGIDGQILTTKGTSPDNYVIWSNPAWNFNGNNIYNNSTFVGIGIDIPTSTLHVNGTLRISDDSEGPGKILTSDALGNASWQMPALGSVNGTVNYLPKFTGVSSLGNSQFYETNNRIGLGTTTPSGKFQIKQDSLAADNEPIFEIKDKSNQTVMVIYKDSAHFFVKDPGGAKTNNRGSFAVSGKSEAKSFTHNYFTVNPDNTHIYTTDTVAGFSVGNILSGSATDYLHLTPLNYFIGHESGINIQLDSLNPGMGQHNTFIGYQAGKSAVGAYQNTFIGYQTGINTIDGAWNIFLGQQAGFSNISGLSNIFIGQESGYNMTNGTNNMCIGKEAGWAATTNVFDNIYIGNNAGRNNTSGYDNTLIGVSAGYNSTSGESNTFIGALTGFSNTGSDNVFMGASAGIYTSIGRKNVYIGSYVANRSTGSGNVFIGYKANNTNFTSNSYNNSIAIGDSVICTANNQVRLGNAATATFYCQGIYAATTASAANVYVSSTGQLLRSTSSKRYKKDIINLDINTSKIYDLRPVTYKSISDNSSHFGLIAEEVALLIPELAEFAMEKDIFKGSKSDKLIPDAVQYPLLSVLLLKEVQNHQKTINELTKENDKLKSEIEIMKKENSEQKIKNTEIDKLKAEIENIKSIIGTSQK